VARGGTNQADLTARELAVLTALAGGLSATAIGRRLGISVGTVDKHLEHIYRKLGCRDRLVAVTIARQLGLLPAKVSISRNGDGAIQSS
jgi:DNA-binding NarL/FixJ family response regulator